MTDGQDQARRKDRPHAVQVTAARVKIAMLLATPGVKRLLDKHEIIATAGATYPTIWEWMRTKTNAAIIKEACQWVTLRRARRPAEN